MYINQRNEKDCLQATLANLLSVEYESIPPFYEAYFKRMSDDDFLLELDTWLNSVGKYRILFDVSIRDDGKIGIPFCCGLDAFLCIGILEKKGRKYSHAVLLRVSRNGKSFEIKIEHDPKPDSECDLFDLVQVEFVASQECAVLAQEARQYNAECTGQQATTATAQNSGRCKK